MPELLIRNVLKIGKVYLISEFKNIIKKELDRCHCTIQKNPFEDLKTNFNKFVHKDENINIIAEQGTEKYSVTIKVYGMLDNENKLRIIDIHEENDL